MPGCHHIPGQRQTAKEMDPLTQHAPDQDAGQLRAGDVAVSNRGPGTLRKLETRVPGYRGSDKESSPGSGAWIPERGSGVAHTSLPYLSLETDVYFGECGKSWAL